MHNWQGLIAYGLVFEIHFYFKGSCCLWHVLSKREKFIVISHKEVSLRGRNQEREAYCKRDKFAVRGRSLQIERVTLIEGVLMDENQNETKDMFLTLCFL